ncbi:galectin-related protein-like isoform X3 [Rhinatrema bivittatum]|uniref:galectin-related protein-like isoform X3 n=1 Tax=Rhinatrema bivittatum TaxID=194408 RepID=UPI001126CD12|nr:galectin-related protein-like isoform X3 [Rhinatrema bivittatum]
MDKMTENDRCAEVEQYFGEIKGGMKPAMRLTIMGMVTSNPRSFAVSLLCSPTDSAKDASDIGFLLAVNFRNKSVTRNAKISGKWGAEEKNIPYFPFTAGENFKDKTSRQYTSILVPFGGTNS